MSNKLNHICAAALTTAAVSFSMPAFAQTYTFEGDALIYETPDNVDFAGYDGVNFGTNSLVTYGDADFSDAGININVELNDLGDLVYYGSFHSEGFMDVTDAIISLNVGAGINLENLYLPDLFFSLDNGTQDCELAPGLSVTSAVCSYMNSDAGVFLNSAADYTDEELARLVTESYINPFGDGIDVSFSFLTEEEYLEFLQEAYIIEVREEIVEASKETADSFQAQQSAVVSAVTEIAGLVETRSLAVVESPVSATGTSSDGSSEEESGVSGGDTFVERHIWGKYTGRKAEQDERKGTVGYDLASHGFIAGIDGKLTEDFLLGSAFSYAQSDVDVKTTRTTAIDVDSYQFTLYGMYNTSSPWYFSGSASVGKNDYEGIRGTATGNAISDYDGMVYSGRVGTGYDYVLNDKFLLTPDVSLQYTYVTQDDYTETGAGDNNISVKSDDIEALLAGVGAKVSYSASKKFKPELRARWTHDFIADKPEITTTSLFTNETFNNSGIRAQKNTYTFGTGFDYNFTDSTTITTAYDLDIKDKYEAHTGSLKVKIAF